MEEYWLEAVSYTHPATEEIYKAGEYLGIHLMDHIIIGDNQYYSFKEQGKF